MSRQYRIQYDMRGLEDVGAHLLRWLLLTVFTAGIALAFYPFYFVRFLAERVTFVQIEEDAQNS